MKPILPLLLTSFLLAAPALRAAPMDRAGLSGPTAPAGAVWLEELGVENIVQTQGTAEAGQAFGDRPLTMKGQRFSHGVGVKARAYIALELRGAATRFQTLFGVDDAAGDGGSVALRVSVDGVLKFDSGVVRSGDEPKLVDVDLRGAKKLELEVLPVDDDARDFADLAGAALFLSPEAIKGGKDARPVILAPPRAQVQLPEWVPAPLQPQIGGPRVTGVSPNKPFLYRVPATGQAPLSFGAQGLPPGLTLDAKTGILSGKIAQAGTYAVALSARNALGSASKTLRIECGANKLALTPIMGWNAWNVFGELVTAKDVAAQADWMVESGLAARGYNTIIVDDTWQSRRQSDGSIGSNRRFGSMKALADYVHAKGLKIGLLSSGTPNTCSGFPGSANFEERDAALFARWGIDLVKYDWCPESGSKNNANRADVVLAYKKMRAALDATNRDIVLQMVTYGFGGWAPDLGSEAGAQLWRTSEGLIDTWDSVANVAFGAGDAARRSKPGGWSDFGPLMIGRFTPRNPHFSNLSPGAQKLQMTAWAIGGSPLILSCDLSQLDPNGFYRLATPLLMNPEVLAINQDEAFQGPRTTWNGDVQVWSRLLSDGTTALALLNRSGDPRKVWLNWNELGLPATSPVRDVWARRDLGAMPNAFSPTVAGRSAALFVVGTPKTMNER